MPSRKQKTQVQSTTTLPDLKVSLCCDGAQHSWMSERSSYLEITDKVFACVCDRNNNQTLGSI